MLPGDRAYVTAAVGSAFDTNGGLPISPAAAALELAEPLSSVDGDFTQAI